MRSHLLVSRLSSLILGLALSDALCAADPTLTAISPDTGTSASDFITATSAPTFTGTADSGSSVQLWVGASAGSLAALGPAVVAGVDGTWSITLPGPVADGTYVVEARATPVGGGADLVSLPQTVVLDTSGASPTISAITPQVGQAGYTNSATPSISGIADPGATVVILVDGVAVGTTTAAAGSGAFAYTTAALVNADYVIGVQQRDVAGNTPAAATTQALVVDTRTTRPLVYRSTAGVAGSVTNNATPGFAGKAEPLATISIHTGTAGGPQVGSATADAEGNWTVAALATPVADGAVTFVAVATDAAGNSQAADNFTLTIDTVPPVSLVESGFTITSSGAPATDPSDERALTWSGSVSGADSVAVTLDGVSVGSVPVSGGVWSYDFAANLPDHTYTLTATARDAAGNTTGPVVATITVHDLFDPPAQRVTPVILDALNQPLRSTRNPVTSFTVIGNPGATVTVVTTVVTAGIAVPPATVTLDAQGTLVYSTPALSDGTYDLRVDFTQLGTTYSSNALRVAIDSVAPIGPMALAMTVDSGISASDLLTNDDQPHLALSGSLDAAPTSGGLTVTTKIDGVTWATHSVDNAGNSAFDAPYTLPDGRYVLSFSEGDAAGNASTTALANQTLVIDTITDVPLAKGITPDSGRFTDDALTNQADLHLIGRAEAGASVSVSISGTSFGAPQTVLTTADASGAWDAVLPTLTTDGAHAITTTATDRAGNTAGPSVAFAVTYDAAAPVTTIASFSPNTGSTADNRTNATSVTVSGTSEAQADVVVALNGGSAKTVRANGSGAWSATFGGLADGSYSVTAAGTDPAGNSGATVSAPALFVVDTQVATPVLGALTTDSSGGSVAAWDTDYRTADQTLIYNGTFSGTAVASGDVFELLLNGVVVATQTPVAGTTTWTVDRTAFTQAEGSYPVVARLTDDVGNTASVSGTLIVDLTPPTVTLSRITVDSGLSFTDFITNSTSLTGISGGTADGRRTGTVLVEILDPGAAVIYSATVITDGATTWSVNAAAGTPALGTLVLTGTPPTTYSIRVTPTDAVGNVGTPVSKPLIIDDDAPVGATASIDSFSHDTGAATGSTSGSVTSDTTPTLSGSTVGAPAGGYVVIYDDAAATTVLGLTSISGGGSWTFTSPTRSPDGLYSYYAQVFDLAGNAAAALSPGFDVVIDTTAPTTAITALTDDTFGTGSAGTASDYLTKDTRLIFGGTIADPHLATAVTSVKVSLSGVFSNRVATLGSGTWTLDRTAAASLVDGTYTLTVVAQDDVANSATVTRTLVVDTTVAAPVPALTAGSDSGSSSSDAVTNDTTPTISGSSEPGAALSVVFTAPAGNGTDVSLTTQADGSGVWSVTPGALVVTTPSLHGDTWGVAATQIDMAGNGPSAAGTLSFTLDTVPPAPPTLVLDAASDTGDSASDHITKDDTPTFSGTAEAFGRITLTCTKGATTVTTTVDADATGAWTATPTTLAAGTWTVTAVQRDLAGNGPSAGTVLAPALVVDVSVAAPVITAITTDSARSGSDPASLASGSDFRTSDTTLTVSGTVEAGATVTFVRDATVLGTVVADGSGAWTFTDPVTHVDGDAPVYAATQVDIAGNASASSVTRTATIDTVAPAAPVIDSVATITAANPASGITSDQTLVLSGTAEADALLTVIIDGTSVGTALADGLGAWSFGPTATLSEGAHTLQARATDVAGNTGVLCAATVITIDITAPAKPVVARILAADDTGVSNSDQLTMLARPTLTGTGEPGATITLREGATVLGSTVALGDGSWSVAPTADFTAGVHALTATATDTAGNLSAVSNPLTITVDLAVAAPVISAVSTDSGISSSDFLTNDTSLSISGTAEAGATVQLFDGATALVSVVAGPSGTWTATRTLTEGAHPLTASATDRAGNVSTVSASVPLVIDLTAPSASVSGIAIDSGASASDALTNDPGLVFLGTAEALATVTVRLDGTVIGTTTAAADGTWAYDHSAVTLASGTYQVTAAATDHAGNTGAWSAAYAVEVDRDNAPPVVLGLTADTDTGISDHDGITANNQPTFVGTADPNTMVTVVIDGVDRGLAMAGNAGTWGWPVSLLGTPLADGTHQIGATSTDAAGNVATALATYTVRIGTSITDPAITGITPDTGSSATDRITAVAAPTLRGSGVPGATLVVTLDGVLGASTTVAGDGTWSVVLAAAADGSHSVTVTQTDTFGNSATSLPVSYTIDTVAPGVPGFLGLAPDTGSSASDLLTATTSPVLGGSGEVGATITVRDGATIIGRTSVGADGLWAYRPTLAEGSHALSFSATDVAGNVSATAATATVVIDTTPPAAGLVSGIAPDTGRSPTDFITASATPTVSGSGEAGTRVEVYDGSTLLGTATVAGDGTWEVVPSFADGAHQLTCVLSDAAGNRSATSAVVTVVTDTQPANPPLILAISDDTGASASDGITSDRTLRVSGTAEPDARIAVSVAGDVIGLTITAGDGTWVLDLSAKPLLDGTYPLIATAEDVAGNTSADSAVFTVVVDGTMSLPLIEGVTDDTGTAGDHLTSDQTPLVSGMADPGATVVLSSNGSAVATVTAATDGTWAAQLSTTPLADGTYVLQAQASDTAGNSATSVTWDLTIDATAPPAPVITSIADDTGTAGDFLTSDQTLIFSGTAEPLAWVIVEIEASPIGVVRVDATGAWTLDATWLVLPGDPQVGGKHYTLTAVAFDAAANVSVPSASRDLGIDSGVSDDIAILGIISDSGTVGDHITSDTSLTVVGVAEPGSTIELFDGATSLGTAVVDSLGLWTFAAVFPAGEADHALSALATDLVGNVNGPSPVFTVRIDTVAPPAPVIVAISNDSGVAGDFVTNDRTLVFSGTAEPAATVTVALAGVALGSAVATAGGDWTFDFTGINLPDGSYRVTAFASDVAGNVGVSSAVRPVVIDTQLATPLLLSSGPDSGLAGDLVTNVVNQTLSGRAEAGCTVSVFIDGVLAGTVVPASDGTWDFGPTSALADGTHVFTASATDLAGNLTPLSTGLTVLIDTAITAPLVTQIVPGTLLSPTTASTGSTAPVLSGTADAGAAVRIRVDGVVVGTVVAAADRSWSLALTGLTEGSHTLMLTSWDLAGNLAASAILNLTVDLTGPTGTAITGLLADGVALAEGGLSQDRTPQIDGTAEAFASVVVYADGVAIGTTTAAADGHWTYTPVSDIAGDGEVRLTAVATDAQGNAGPASAPWRVTLLATRHVEIESERCGTGANFALVGVFLAALLRLSLRPRTAAAGFGLGCVASLGLAGGVQAAETAPVPLRFGAKLDALSEVPGVVPATAHEPWALWNPPRPAGAAEPAAPPLFHYGAKLEAVSPVVPDTGPAIRPEVEWLDVRIGLFAMPEPDQDASYLRAGYAPGSSSWDTTIRGEIETLRNGRDFAWGGIMAGLGLGYFRVTGDEQPASVTAPHFNYRIDTLPIDLQAGARVDLGESWWLEGRGIFGAGPTRIAIDAPASAAGNLLAATGVSRGVYTEYGVALAVTKQLDEWELTLEGRYLRGMHSGAFRRNEYIGSTLVQSDEVEVRLEQTGFLWGLTVGRWF
jgi:hypothetical protein